MLSSLLRLARRWPYSLCFVSLALLLELSFLSGLPYSFRFIVDDGIVAGDHERLWLILSALAAGALLFAVVGTLRDRALARLIARIVGRLRGDMLSHCDEAPQSWLGQRRRGDLMARFSGDLSAVEHSLHAAAPFALLPGLEVLANTLLLFTLDWRLALLSLLVFPAALLGPRFLMPRANRAADRRRQLEATLLSSIDEHIASQRDSRAYGTQGAQLQRYERQAESLRTSIARQGFLSALIERSANSAILLLNVLTLAYGCWLVLHGDLTLGALAAFQSLFLSLSWALSYLAQYAPIWVSARSAFSRIQDVLNAPKLAPGNHQNVPRLQRLVAFRGVHFAYGERAILQQVSFDITAGRSLAIVGGSGSGKSTALSLLLGFEWVNQGDITIDGKSIRALDLGQWRRQLGVVFQDTYIFAASIADNLRVGKLDATEKELELAARQAGIHDVIMGMPKGYDTVVGEAHVTLSGGQRQRIGIARALLRQPTLLLLDEPTSALDVVAEQQIQETLFQITRGRTMVLVTHRLEQAARCDHVVVLEQGRVVESGEPSVLLERNGRYASMWRKQRGFSFEGSKARISIQRLAETALFEGLSDSALEQIAAMFSTEHARAGEWVIRQGEVGDRFYLLARGMAEVVRTDEKGREHALAILSDGDPFGEIALLAARPRTASVRVLLDCTLLTLTKAQLDHIVKELPEVATRMRMTAMDRLKAQR